MLLCRKALQVFRGANVKRAGRKGRAKEPDGKSLYKHIVCKEPHKAATVKQKRGR